jgi:hypothetical protein
MNTNNGGVTNIDVLSVGALYVNGQRLKDLITSLISQDAFEQVEIDEIKLLLQYLNTSGLSSEWILDNNNKNQDLKTSINLLNTRLLYYDGTALSENWIINNDNRNVILKTAIDLINTRLLYIDTTALSQSSILNNDNRNSVLKTRIDGNDGSLATLNSKTQYITTTVGNNDVNPKTFSQHSIIVSNAGQKKRILLSPYPSLVGAFNINLSADETVGEVGTDLWAENNRINMTNQNGNIEIEAKKTHILGKIELGEFSDVLVNRLPINIGGSMARINIGSEKTPKTGTGPGDPDTDDSTIITIGKLGTLKNTWCYLNGNLYTSNARFESLNVTDVITWATVASWATGFVFSGVPYWLAWIALSGVPNYRYSDVVKMANNYLTGGLTKNHAIETSNDLALQKLSVIDTSVVSLNTAFDAVLGRLCFQAFTIHGSHSIGSIIGKTNIYAGSGEVELRVDGGVFDWAFKNAGNSNRVLLTNTDVEVVQCNGTGGTGRLKLVAGNGNIDFETANNGVRSSTTKVMEIKANKQIVIGSNSNIVDDTYKMIIDATSHANGVFIRKGNDTLLLNPTNVSSKSLTLQSGYAGTTANALYLSEGGQLMFNGSVVGSSTGGGTGGGIIYLLSGPTSDITYTAANLFLVTYEMTATYLSRATTSIRFGTYTAGQSYNLFNHRGAIPRASSNPILKGAYELNPYIRYNGSGGANANWYADAYFYADGLGTLSPFETTLITKNYPLALQGGTSFQYLGSVGTTAFIPTNNNAFVLNIRQVRFPFINIFGANLNFRCEIVDTDNSIVLYTFPILVLTSQNGGATTSQVDMTFDAGSVIKVDQGFIWIGTRFRFRLTLVSGSSSCFFSQQTAFNIANMSFSIPNFTGVNFTTPISMNGANRAILTNSSTQVLSSLTLPITDYDISIFSNPQFDLRFFFAQPSGGTNNHYVDFHFWDGSLSHIHTSINTALAQVPGLGLVMNSGNSASTTLNMNSNGITNIPFGGLNGTDGLAWNVKNITAGTGISATNNGNGLVTISSTSSITSIGLRYGGPLTALVNFNMAQSYSLATHRVTGRANLFVTNLFDYPVIRISGVGDVASTTNTNEQSYSWHTYYQNPSTNSENLHNTATNNNWLDRSCTFSNINLPNPCEVLLEFSINLIRDPQGANGGNNSVIRGRATWISKVAGQLPAFKMYGLFERHTAATTFGSITLGSYGGYDPSVTQANLQVEIIPLPTF